MSAIALDEAGAGCSVIADGTVRCWGYNTSGENGDGTAEPAPDPVLVQGLSDVVAVAIGARHRCALLEDGTVQCWGANNQGQLGNGPLPPPANAGPADAFPALNPPAESALPVPVPGITDAVAIAASDGATCVATRSGTIECWGELSGLRYRATLSGVEGIVDLAFGLLGNGVHLLTSAGEVLTWSWPQFYDEDPARILPGPVIPGALALEGGDYHLCALTGAGEVSCWGASTLGALGLGNVVRRTEEPLTVAALSNVVALGAGENHNCAVLAEGSVWCWGRNDATTWREDREVSYSVPTLVRGIEGAVKISSGGESRCAILEDTTARCWGRLLLDTRTGRTGSRPAL